MTGRGRKVIHVSPSVFAFISIHATSILSRHAPGHEVLSMGVALHKVSVMWFCVTLDAIFTSLSFFISPLNIKHVYLTVSLLVSQLFQFILLFYSLVFFIFKTKFYGYIIMVYLSLWYFRMWFISLFSPFSIYIIHFLLIYLYNTWFCSSYGFHWGVWLVVLAR